MRSVSPVRGRGSWNLTSAPKSAGKPSSDMDNLDPQDSSSHSMGTDAVKNRANVHDMDSNESRTRLTSSGHSSSKGSFRVSRVDSCNTDSRSDQMDPHNSSFKHTSSFRRAVGALNRVKRSTSSDRMLARTESSSSIRAGDASHCPSFRQMIRDSSMCVYFASVNVRRAKVRAEICGIPMPPPSLCSREASNLLCPATDVVPKFDVFLQDGD